MALKLGRWHLSLALVFLILGVLLSVSFYTQQRWQKKPSLRREKLIDLVEANERQRQRLESELQKLRTAVSDYEEKAAGEEGALVSLTNELDRLRFIAGLTPVKGPGLEIILGDALRVPPDGDSNNYIIHDYDLQIVVNALWRGGAEAIAVNGQRFIATTGIRCAGSTILINGKPLGNPYKIQVVGNSGRLERMLNKDSDASRFLNSYAKTFDLVVNVKKVSNLKLPAYQGSLRTEKTGG